jgi:hypothetical protein
MLVACQGEPTQLAPCSMAAAAADSATQTVDEALRGADLSDLRDRGEALDDPFGSCSACGCWSP